MSRFSTLLDLIDLHNKSNCGYDQSQRWSWFNEAQNSINYGAEGDCSAVTIGLIAMAGYPVKKTYLNGRGTCYTGNAREILTEAGWKATNVKGWTLAQLRERLQPGDVLLVEKHHIVIMGRNRLLYSMNIDENGNAIGGHAGDQTGNESSFRPLWAYRGIGWDYLISPPDRTATPTPAKVQGPTAYPQTTLAKGSTGAAVKALQAGLLAKFPAYAGPIKASGGADGVFGSATESVVKEFQRRSKLTADGIVGPMTKAALATYGIKF